MKHIKSYKSFNENILVDGAVGIVSIIIVTAIRMTIAYMANYTLDSIGNVVGNAVRYLSKYSRFLRAMEKNESFTKEFGELLNKKGGVEIFWSSRDVNDLLDDMFKLDSVKLLVDKYNLKERDIWELKIQLNRTMMKADFREFIKNKYYGEKNSISNQNKP